MLFKNQCLAWNCLFQTGHYFYIVYTICFGTVLQVAGLEAENAPIHPWEDRSKIRIIFGTTIMKNVKLLVRFGVGYDKVDLKAVSRNSRDGCYEEGKA